MYMYYKLVFTVVSSNTFNNRPLMCHTELHAWHARIITQTYWHKKPNNSLSMHAKLMQLCVVLKKHLTYIIPVFLFPKTSYF